MSVEPIRPSEPQAPITTIVTKRTDEIEHQTVASTPSGQPNVSIVPLPSWKIILIRAARVYLQSLLGFLTGAGVLNAVGVAAMPALSVLPTLPTGFLGTLSAAALLALPPATGSLIQNTLELLARIDVNYPQVRA